MKIATFVTLTVVGARRRLTPTVDSRLRGNDEREVIFNRAQALHAFYLTAWVFLPDHVAAGHRIGAPVFPVTIYLAGC
jgi:hypothetical protein